MARKFPIGIQSFEKIRTNGYVYIDKTEYIYKMVQEGSAYFLSRPRRFGKSLLVSTLEAYFKGKRELFEGLDIEKEEREWKVYPVLHIDLNARNYENKDSLLAILNQHLEKWEEEYGEEKNNRKPEERFSYLIEKIYNTTGSPVVVLVDEYDKPLLQSIHNEPLQQEYRAILKAFYGVLKSTDAYLKFVFLTGVTKFGQVSVFSDLNHLKDISQDARYGNLCGITPGELQENFPQELVEFAQKENTTVENLCARMKNMYDGYRFNHTMQGVYNPFSLLNAMDAMEFRSYWFSTGTPTFLIELLKKSDYDLRRLESIEIDESQFTSYRAGNSDPIPVIYQSGYLTIKGYDERFRIYRLGFPNDEVKYGFLNSLIPYYTSLSGEENTFHIRHFVSELEEGDTDAFLQRMKVFFSSIPYELHESTEKHYQAVFYLVFRLLGQFINAEVRSANGRADAVVKTEKFIYVFEFKLDGSAEDALKQIDDKGYMIPYTLDGKSIIKIGVNFDMSIRNIADWKVEK